MSTIDCDSAMLCLLPPRRYSKLLLLFLVKPSPHGTKHQFSLLRETWSPGWCSHMMYDSTVESKTQPPVHYSAAALLAMQSTVLATAILSVRLSHAGTISRWMKIGPCGLHCEIAKTLLVFWYQHRLGGDVLFHLKFALRLTHPLWKAPTRPISTYNVSTIRASKKVQSSQKKKPTTRFPMSYRWSAYVTPNSPK